MPTIVYTLNSTGGDSTALADTHLDSTAPTTNLSSSAIMNVDAYITPQRVGGCGILRMTDLSGIPAGSTIDSVQVDMYRASGFSSGGVNIGIHRCLQANVIAQATWNIYSTGNNWDTAGGLTAGTDHVGTASGTLAVDNSNGYKSSSEAGLASDVQDWLDGTVSNYGWLLIPENVDEAFCQFETCEGTDANRPKVTVTYTAASGGLAWIRA